MTTTNNTEARFDNVTPEMVAEELKASADADLALASASDAARIAAQAALAAACAFAIHDGAPTEAGKNWTKAGGRIGSAAFIEALKKSGVKADSAKIAANFAKLALQKVPTIRSAKTLEEIAEKLESLNVDSLAKAKDRVSKWNPAPTRGKASETGETGETAKASETGGKTGEVVNLKTDGRTDPVDPFKGMTAVQLEDAHAALVAAYLKAKGNGGAKKLHSQIDHAVKVLSDAA